MAGHSLSTSARASRRVGTLGLRRQAGDHMVGFRAVGPLVGVGPKPQLELQAAPRRFVADEAQHLQVPVPLGVGQVGRPHVVARDGEQERVGEVEVGVAQPVRGVVAEAEGQIEPVEALGDQHRQVAPPEVAIVKPGLVLDGAGERTHHAADRIGGPLGPELRRMQRRGRIVGHPRPRARSGHRPGPAHPRRWRPAPPADPGFRNRSPACRRLPAPARRRRAPRPRPVPRPPGRNRPGPPRRGRPPAGPGSPARPARPAAAAGPIARARPRRPDRPGR